MKRRGDLWVEKEMDKCLSWLHVERTPLWQEKSKLDPWLSVSMEIHLNFASGTAQEHNMETPVRFWL